MEHSTNAPTTPQKALFTIRIIWAALILGQVAFLFVIMILRASAATDDTAHPDTAQLMFYLSAGMLAMAFPMGVALRKVLYGPDRPVPPARYFTGTIIFLALLEGVSLLGLAGVLVGQVFWPNLIVPIAALAIQAISFPTGAPMEQPPSYVLHAQQHERT